MSAHRAPTRPRPIAPPTHHQKLEETGYKTSPWPDDRSAEIILYRIAAFDHWIGTPILLRNLLVKSENYAKKDAPLSQLKTEPATSNYAYF